MMFRLDGVTVCSEYFTVALGFNYPNRRIADFVRLIKVNKLYVIKNININTCVVYCLGRSHGIDWN